MLAWRTLLRGRWCDNIRMRMPERTINWWYKGDFVWEIRSAIRTLPFIQHENLLDISLQNYEYETFSNSDREGGFAWQQWWNGSSKLYRIKNLSKTQSFHITTYINMLDLWRKHNPIYNVLIEWGWYSCSTLGYPVFQRIWQ